MPWFLLALLAVAGGAIWRATGRGSAISIATGIIKPFEAYSPTPYDDYEQISIGYGCRWEEGMPEYITEPEAARLLEERIRNEYAPAVFGATEGLGLTPAKQAALISFVFNVGPGGMGGGWFRKFKAGDLEDARHRFLQWNKAGGQTLPGLISRRKVEWYMFRTGVHNPAAAEMQEGELPL